MRIRSRAHPLRAAALLCGALILATPALAQGRWREIGTTSSGNPVFVDARSVKRGADGIVTATIRIKYLTPVKTPSGALRSSRAVALLDCTRRVTATKESTMYLDERETQVAQRTVNKVPGYSSPIRGTPPDLALQHLCTPRAP